MMQPVYVDLDEDYVAECLTMFRLCANLRRAFDRLAELTRGS